MRFVVLEDLRDTDFTLSSLKTAVYNTIPLEDAAADLYDGMVDNLGDKGIDEVTSFIQSLKFPLRIYRGLKLRDRAELDVHNLGVHWTVDDTLFYEHSAFNFITHILTGYIKESAVDWENTIQHYVLYSRNKNSGKYPENEITLKKDAKVYNLELYRK